MKKRMLADVAHQKLKKGSYYTLVATINQLQLSYCVIVVLSDGRVLSL